MHRAKRRAASTKASCRLITSGPKPNWPLFRRSLANRFRPALVLASMRAPTGFGNGLRWPIVNPFFDVAVHVIQTPGVRRRLPYNGRDRLGRRIPALRRVFQKRGRQGVAGVEVRLGSRPRGVFPLRFRGQPVGLVLFLRQPLAKLVCVRPTDKHDRFVVFFCKAELSLQRAMRRSNCSYCAFVTSNAPM